MKINEINYHYGNEQIGPEFYLDLSHLFDREQKGYYQIRFRSQNMEGATLTTRAEVDKLIMELNSIKKYLK